MSVFTDTQKFVLKYVLERGKVTKNQLRGYLYYYQLPPSNADVKRQIQELIDNDLLVHDGEIFAIKDKIRVQRLLTTMDVDNVKDIPSEHLDYITIIEVLTEKLRSLIDMLNKELLWLILKSKEFDTLFTEELIKQGVEGDLNKVTKALQTTLLKTIELNKEANNE